MIIYFIIGVVVLLLIAPSSKDYEEQKSAKFGSLSDHVSLFNKGISITGGFRATTLETATKGTLIIGASGSGKTATVLSGSIHTLARGGTSLCIMDVSGELYQLHSGWLAKKGYNIYKLDFTKYSDGFNFLELCSSVSELQQISHLLIKNGSVTSTSDPYWSSSAEMLLSLFLQYVRFHTEERYRSMFNVVRLIETFAASPKTIDALMIRTKNSQLISSYRTIVAIPLKTLHSIISTTLASLKIFKNEQTSRCTAKNTIPFLKFRSEKSALFICIPLPQLGFFAPIATLVFETMFNEILSRIPAKEENHIAVLLDEMPVCRFSSGTLGQVWSNCRKYKGIAVGVVQHEKMLEMNCTPAEAMAIKSNSYCRIYLKGQSLDTSKLLEDTLGRQVCIDERGEYTKPLMDAASIRQSNEAILIIGNCAPLKEKMIPYYEHFILSQRTQIPVYELKEKIPFDEPPLLQFEEQ